MAYGMDDFSMYSRLATRVEINGGDIRDRDDVLDAIVELSCDEEHFTDEELHEIADVYFELQDMLP